MCVQNHVEKLKMKTLIFFPENFSSLFDFIALQNQIKGSFDFLKKERNQISEKQIARKLRDFIDLQKA